MSLGPTPTRRIRRRASPSVIFGATIGAEYRAQAHVHQPDLGNTTTQRRAGWIEHRLRLDGSVDYVDKVRIVTSIDILDGVLWGDKRHGRHRARAQRRHHCQREEPKRCSSLHPVISEARRAIRSTATSTVMVSVMQKYSRCDVSMVKAVTPVGVFRVGRQAVHARKQHPRKRLVTAIQPIRESLGMETSSTGFSLRRSPSKPSAQEAA